MCTLQLLLVAAQCPCQPLNNACNSTAQAPQIQHGAAHCHCPTLYSWRHMHSRLPVCLYCCTLKHLEQLVSLVQHSSLPLPYALQLAPHARNASLPDVSIPTKNQQQNCTAAVALASQTTKWLPYALQLAPHAQPPACQCVVAR
jgi:hypothetical protein